MRKAAPTDRSFNAYNSGTSANQISQSNPILGKAPLSSMPLTADNSMFFLFRIKSMKICAVFRLAV